MKRLAKSAFVAGPWPSMLPRMGSDAIKKKNLSGADIYKLHNNLSKKGGFIMTKRFFKWFTVLLISVMCLMVLTSCSQNNSPAGKEGWDGSYYMQVDDENTIVFSITMDEAKRSLYVERVDVYTPESGGRSSSSVARYAELTGDNTAENADFYFTINGDILTVEALEAETFGSEYEGKYKRGVSFDESSDDDSESDGGSDYGAYELQMGQNYYRDRDEEKLCLYFYENGSVLASDPDRSEFGVYTIDGSTVTVTVGNDTLVLDITSNYTLEDSSGWVYSIVK